MEILCGKKLGKILKIGAKIEFSKVPKCEQFGFLGSEWDFKELEGHFKIIKSHLNRPTRKSLVRHPHLLLSLRSFPLPYATSVAIPGEAG